jgi:hypothetical protein
MERRREDSKRRGVRRCWRVFGGMRGDEAGMIRAVGRCFGYVGRRDEFGEIRNLSKRINAHRFIGFGLCLTRA